MDTFALIAAERRSLADALDDLGPDDWSQPSLCGSWTTHQVAAHLNVPFAVSSFAFVVALAKARGSFDRANERVAVELATHLDPAACVAGLRTHAESHFTPPGFGPEAPLTDTIVHGGDILRPVGRALDVPGPTLEVALRFVASRKAQRGFGAVGAEGLELAPTDLDVTLGEGARIAGPARSLVCALVGRTAFLEDLDGPGVEHLRTRC